MRDRRLVAQGLRRVERAYAFVDELRTKRVAALQLGPVNLRLDASNSER
jgi:hypothetical protein